MNGPAIGRTLPHSLEAEKYLLSCCLLDGADVLSRCLEARIKPESFYDPKHGIVYERLLVEAGEAAQRREVFESRVRHLSRVQYE